MKRRAFLHAAACGGLALAARRPARSAEPAAAPARKPNIVVIVADDLGYRDVSFNGGSVPTPAIDRIAQEGVTLTRFYACPICSPTRAGTMTGRWPLRMGIMRAVITPWRKWGIPAAEKTLAELLADAGYARRAIIGKWHLGHASKKYHPLNNGFTYFYGHYNGAIDYWTHQREGETDWHRNWDTLHEEGYTTDLLGDDAARFIRESPAGQPFFLYLPFNAVHSPLQAPDADVARFPGIANKSRRIYAGMTVAMDRAVGKVLSAIDARDDADNTFVLFFADNGGVPRVADNGPLRAGKTTVYEGGIRVCACARWPAGGIRPGTTVDGLMGYIDVYPTVKRLAGLADTADPNPLDGIDVLDVMRGKAKAPRRDWFSYIHQSGPEEHLSVIDGPFKLVVHSPAPGILADGARAKSRCELYHLDNDPREQTNLAERHPDMVDRLWKKLLTFRSWKLEGVTAFDVGRKGFKAPKDWILPD